MLYKEEEEALLLDRPRLEGLRHRRQRSAKEQRNDRRERYISLSLSIYIYIYIYIISTYPNHMCVYIYIYTYWNARTANIAHRARSSYGSRGKWVQCMMHGNRIGETVKNVRIWRNDTQSKARPIIWLVINIKRTGNTWTSSLWATHVIHKHMRHSASVNKWDDHDRNTHHINVLHSS